VIIEEFLDELADSISDTHKLERVLSGSETLSIADLNNQPEEWTEGNLIWPLIEAVGLNREPGRPASQRSAAGTTQREAPDFRLVEREGDLVVIGENKSPNKVDLAEEELVTDYLSNKAWPDYGIATDGFEWVLYRAEHGGDFLEFNEVKRVTLRPAINAVARDLGYLGSGSIDDADGDDPLAAFVSTFAPENLHTLLTQTAPKEFRDTRNANVEEFYELYIELLFGVSDEHDYDTCLRDDIQPPHNATDTEKDLFAVTLMNRLLFVKFLETRDVLPNGFLRTLVGEYEDNADTIPGTLYETFIKPLFYDLFNTPEEERHPKLRTGQYADVPYLNGGLFRENIPNESQFNLLDRTLPTIINDLIEGHRLELNGRSFDPAILGSVFEKTINHIGGEQGRQKEIGAYYTPNDVTRHISERTVDPKVKDLITEAFVEHSAGDNEQYVRDQIADADLQEILRYIEDGVGMYGATPEALAAVRDRLTDLTVLDPACGSGHFLTTAMEELHQVQLSVMRGLNGGDDPSREERFEAKQDLALNAIYGVDVDEVAVEIAKLRVWLKIVEGNSWDEDFGRLPNIDVNIVAGNSLVGFPVRGDVQTQMGAVDDRLPDLAERRRAYKFENRGGRQEIMALEADIREDRDEKYLQHLTYTLDTEITDKDEFDALVASVSEGGFYPTIQSVKVQRHDGDGDAVALTDDDKETLAAAGFEWQEWRDTNKSATLDIEERLADTNSAQGELSEHDAIIQDLQKVLEAGFVFPAVERQPTRYDLDRINGTPLHWDIEFPELLPLEETNGLHPDVSFDIVVGNPPYGDILNGSEETFTEPFMTSSVNDVSAPFVERQLQLLSDDGHFGNVTTLRLVYQSTIHEFYELLRHKLRQTSVACFAKRPAHIFDNAQVRVALLTGQCSDGGLGDIRTSEFIRFDQDDREERLSEVTYENTDGYVLGDKIGTGEERYAILPKVGKPKIRSILETLKQRSTVDGDDRVFGNTFTRDAETEWDVWRMRHPDNWINPMLREMYDAQDLEPMYFETELERDAAFLIMSSSTFYLYWMVYGNQRDLNWGQVEAYPYPAVEKLEDHRETIHQLASDLWAGMEDTFTTDPNPHYENMSGLKPYINAADELFGEIYGLSDDEIEFVKQYDSNYGRRGPERSELEEY
jgi:hypothetical protein